MQVRRLFHDLGRLRLPLAAGALALALLGGLGAALQARAQAPAAIAVCLPAPAEVLEADGLITATVVVTAEQVYGYQFVLTFDPALVEAQAAGMVDDWLRPVYIPPGWSATIDNTAGCVRFAASQVRPDPPVSGTGTLAWVRFAGRSPASLPATATIGIADPRLATRDGDRITPTVTPGSLRVLPRAVIRGQVELQARSAWGGARVTALPQGIVATADAAGWYTLTLPAAACTLHIEMPRYLDAERSLQAARGLNSLPRVRLLAGDADDSDEIDIVDMSIIGGKYGTEVDPLSERADINADGLVDIVDFSVAGGNYTALSPVPWP